MEKNNLSDVMFETIDKVWSFMIVHAPSWKWTSRLMRWKHSWYSRYRTWNDEQRIWVKVK